VRRQTKIAGGCSDAKHDKSRATQLDLRKIYSSVPTDSGSHEVAERGGDHARSLPDCSLSSAAPWGGLYPQNHLQDNAMRCVLGVTSSSHRLDGP
jgi:hypothetical protein